MHTRHTEKKRMKKNAKNQVKQKWVGQKKSKCCKEQRYVHTVVHTLVQVKVEGERETMCKGIRLSLQKVLHK